MSPTLVNAVATSIPTSGDTSVPILEDEKKKRLELITYVKAHFDLISVTLLVAYLGISLYNEMKKNKS